MAAQKAVDALFTEAEYEFYAAAREADRWNFNDPEQGSDEAQSLARATLRYYNLALREARNLSEDLLSKTVAFIPPGELENLQKLANGLINGMEFLQKVFGDLEKTLGPVGWFMPPQFKGAAAVFKGANVVFRTVKVRKSFKNAGDVANFARRFHGKKSKIDGEKGAPRDFQHGGGSGKKEQRVELVKKRKAAKNDKERKSDRERVRSTPEEQRCFLQEKLRTSEWQNRGHKIDGERAYYESKTDLWYTKVKKEKNDFEAWKVSGKTAKHQGAIEPKNGTMYEGPKHPDAIFE